MNKEIQIIDCHCHLSITEGEDWNASKSRILKDRTVNGVSKTIVIADNVANSNCADVFRLIDLLSDEKDFYFVGAIYPFKYSETDIDRFQKLVNEKKIVGMKIFPGHDKIYLNDKRFERIYHFCLENSIPLMVHTGLNSPNDKKPSEYNDPKYIAEIAKRFPELIIVIAHFYWPKIEYCIEITSGISNIYFDTSAIADDDVQKHTGAEVISKSLTNLITHNPEKVMFGTDYPMCDTSKHVSLVNELNISSIQRNKIFSSNAQRIFRLDS